MSKKVGILAYRSLVVEPGDEIQPLIVGRINCVTPCMVEYARLSKSRGNAPTLVPVEKEGGRVNAVVLVLKETISLDDGKNMLWRREIRQADKSKVYKRNSNPGKNSVQVEVLENFEGIGHVIYTVIPRNIQFNMPVVLAAYAVRSILSKAGDAKLDGVRYLLNAKNSLIVTPLSAEYEAEILKNAKTNSLEEGIKKFDAERPESTKTAADSESFEKEVVELVDLINLYGFQKT